MPVVSGHADFEKLTRQHAIKVVANIGVSVEEVSLAVGEVVGCQSVKSASRMNGAIVLFLDDVTKVETVVENGIVVRDTFTPVLPLISPTKKIVISNAPPFIKNEILAKELSRYGKVVSPVKMVLLGCKSAQLKHVVCHRRQVYMILNENKDLNLTFSFKVDGFNYTVFATSDKMKCFECGAEGHLIRSCPERAASATAQAAGSSGEAAVSPSGTIDAQSAVQSAPRPDINDTELDQQNALQPQSNSLGAQPTNTETGLESEPAMQEDNSETNGENGKVQTSEKAQENKQTKKHVSKEKNKQRHGGIGAKSVPKVDVVSDEAKLSKTPENSQINESQQAVGTKVVQNMVFGPVSVAGGKNDIFEDVCLSNKSGKRKMNDKEQNQAKAKKSEIIVSDEDEEDECEWSPSSQEPETVFYPLEKIKKFLSDTKGLRGLQIEDFYPDLKGFVRSVTLLMKESVFTDQEVYRLKKMVSKVKTMLNNDDE